LEIPDSEVISPADERNAMAEVNMGHAAVHEPVQDPKMTTADPSLPALPLVLRTYQRCFPGRNYGEVIVGGAILSVWCAAPGHSFVMGVFTEDLVRDLQVSRSTISAMWSIAMFSSSTTVNLMGRAVDRAGAECVVRASAAPFAGAMVCVGLSTNPVMLCLGYYLTRVFGPEGVDFAARNCVNQWWIAKRGRVHALLSVAGAGLYTFPVIIALVRDAIGWRMTLCSTGIILGGLTLLLSFVLMPPPEELGLLPDGEARSTHWTPVGTSEEVSEEPSETESATLDVAADSEGRLEEASSTASDDNGPVGVNFTLSEAAQTTAFWSTLTGARPRLDRLHREVAVNRCAAEWDLVGRDKLPHVRPVE